MEKQGALNPLSYNLFGCAGQDSDKMGQIEYCDPGAYLMGMAKGCEQSVPAATDIFSPVRGISIMQAVPYPGGRPEKTTDAGAKVVPCFSP